MSAGCQSPGWLFFGAMVHVMTGMKACNNKLVNAQLHMKSVLFHV